MKKLLKIGMCFAICGLSFGARMAVAQTPRYQLIDLGATADPQSYGLAINERGQVAGYGRSARGSRAFVFSDGRVTELSIEGGTNSYATSMNMLGQVAGFFQGANGPRAFLYGQGRGIVFSDLADVDHYALGLNNSGWVVGYAEDSSGQSAFLFDGNELLELPGLGGSSSVAYGINSAGTVVGSSRAAGQTRARAVFWAGREISDLSAAVQRGYGWELEEARAINDAGDMTGSGMRNGVREAFLVKNGRITGLGVLPNGLFSTGFGLNGSNQVVGVAGMRGLYGTRAFLWDQGTLIDLNTVLPAGSGWELREARGINNSGQIVGWGNLHGEDHAYLISPVISEKAVDSQKAVSKTAQPTGSARFFTVASIGSSVSVTNNPLADAHVRQGASNNVNFGLAPLMELQTGPSAGTNKDVYLMFSMANAPSPLGSAKLRIFASYSNNGSVTSTVYSVSDTNWTETGIKWTNRPALGSVLTNQIFNVKAGASYDIDVTSYLRAEQSAGRGIITLALHNLTNTTLLTSISSLQNATTNNRPKLILLTNTPPTVSITSPASGAAFPAPTNFVISVTSSDPDGTVTNLDLYAGGLLIGRKATNAFSFTWTNAPVGTFALTARATDNLGCTVTSAVVNVVVTTNLIAVADSYVTNGNPNANFGLTNLLFVQTNGATGPIQDTYLMFNLSSVTNISSAKIRISASISASGTGSSTYYTVADTNWAETGITWNNKPPRSNALSHVRVTSTTAAWFTNDITAFVQGEKAAGRNLISLALHSQTNATIFTRINSRQAASNRVEIIVTTTNSPPTVAITNPANGSLFIAPANLSLQASASDVDGSVSQVEFFAGSTSLGVDTSVPYGIVWSNAPSGVHALTARATDNYGLVRTSVVVSVTVDIPPTITLTAPANGANFTAYPTNITISANASDSDGTISKVDFFTNGVLLATDTSSPYSVPWSNVPAGVHTISARATDNVSVTSDLALLTVKVGLPPTVSLTSPTDGAVFSTLVSIPLSATAVDTDGTVKVVEFFAGQTKLGESINAPYSATWSNAPAGVHVLTARAIDNHGLVSTSAPVNITVNFTVTDKLRMWLKADAVSGVANGGPLSIWLDSGSAGNNVTQSTAGLQPLWLANILNGKPAVRFDGIDDVMAGAKVMATNDFTIVAVARAAVDHEIDPESSFGSSDGGGGSGQRYLIGDFRGEAQSFGGANGLASLSWGTNGISVYEHQRSASGNDFLPAKAVHVGQTGPGFSVVTLTYAARQPRIHLNGGLARVGVASERPSVHAPGVIGGVMHPYSGVTNYFAGDVAEVLLFDYSLLPAERESIERYLNGKYSVVVAVPGPASNLTATAVSSTQTSLTWSAGTGGVAGFKVERKLGASGAWQSVASVPTTVTGWLDNGLGAGTQYFYRVRAYNLFGDSDNSNEAAVTTLGSIGAIPTAELGLWLRADAEVHADAAGKVNIWGDQSAQANDALQFTNINQTSLVFPPNGRPFVHFDGTNDILHARAWPATNEFSIFFVARTVAGHEIDAETNNYYGGFSGQQFLLEEGGYEYKPGSPPYQTVGGAAVSIGTNGMTFYEYQRNLVGFDYYPPQAVYSNSLGSDWMMIGAVYSNRQARLYHNGSLARVGLPSLRPTALAPTRIGGVEPFCFSGDLAEILIFRRALSASEQDAVGRYFSQKYSLPGTPPAAPAGLLAQARSASTLTLSWTPGSANESSFIVERKLGAAGSYAQIGSAGAGNASFLDTALVPTNQYFYRVKAYNYWGESAYSAEISPPTARMASPLNLAVVTTGLVSTITALATDADGTIASVEFFDYAASLGVDAASPYTLAWSTTNAGAHRLVVKVTDNQGHTRLSEPVNLRVALDRDGDGLNDLDEITLGTNPNLTDTDGDGVPDGQDAFPLDPARWLPPSSTPGDTTPPDIILDEPEDAGLLP